MDGGWGTTEYMDDTLPTLRTEDPAQREKLSQPVADAVRVPNLFSILLPEGN